MTENIRVNCLLERYWDTAALAYTGTEYTGTLIEIAMQSAEEEPGRLIPVGIILLDDNTFHSVPMEYVTKTTA